MKDVADRRRDGLTGVIPVSAIERWIESTRGGGLTGWYHGCGSLRVAGEEEGPLSAVQHATTSAEELRPRRDSNPRGSGVSAPEAGTLPGFCLRPLGDAASVSKSGSRFSPRAARIVGAHPLAVAVTPCTTSSEVVHITGRLMHKPSDHCRKTARTRVRFCGQLRGRTGPSWQ